MIPLRVRVTAVHALTGAVLAVLSLAGWSTAASAAAPEGAEAIRSYDVQLTLAQDTSMQVRETIEYDFGTLERRGIYRTIPVAFEYDEDYRRVYPIDDLEVSSPSGAPDDVEVTGGATTSIRIGNPDVTVTGRHTYVIEYTVRGVVNDFADHEELYWNVVGDEWDVPVDAVTASLQGPAPVDDALCFMGSQGSTMQCEVDGVGDGAGDGAAADGAVDFTAADLQPRQGVTVVAAFPAGTFPQAGPILEEIWKPQNAFSFTPVTGVASGGLLALIVGGVVALVSRRGRDEQYLGVTPGLEPGLGQDDRTVRVPLVGRDAVAVQFTPPKGLRAGQIGTLLDEQANVVDVTATIIDLAVCGLLRVEEIEKQGWFGSGDWRLVRVREPVAGELHAYETKLYNAVFKGREQVLLSDLKQTFSADLAAVQNLLYDDVTQRQWFRGNPASVRLKWRVLGVVLLAAGIGLTVLLAAFTRFGLVGVAVALGGLVLVVLAPRMPARTARGTAVLAQANGFRTYLETAEAGQIRFEEGEDIFSRYLPYAIVFGVAERWAGVFARLAAGGAAVAVPTWYVGHAYASGAFDYGGFGHSMQSFTTTASGALAAATPSSSGSSGFGGGGFSGGGGGGGGGGSW